MSDPSVVHVPSHEMSFQQASQFSELMESMAGREKLLEWLKANDPVVHHAFRMANGICGSHGDYNRAVVIILANALRNCGK